MKYFSLAIFIFFSIYSFFSVQAQTAKNNNIQTLFFSEYIEGGGNNKAFEIFNPTDNDIDLGNYIVLGNYNGNPFYDTLRFSPGTILASMDVYVVAHAVADPVITGVADSLIKSPFNDDGTSYIASFNGDDTRALVHIDGTDSTTIDYFGNVSEDPGSGWDVAGVANGTKDHTLVRKSSIQSGNPIPLASFGSDSGSSEWVVYDKDYLKHIGSHPDSSDVQDFYIDENGVTIICKYADVGDTWEYFGVVYTKRTADQITTNNAASTCTSGITDMSGLLTFDTTFNEDISHWDVSNATDMSYMFYDADYFNQDIGSWDVSSVTDMSFMFQGIDIFNQDIGKWDVSNVTDMREMFQGTRAFNQDIGSWDVSSVTYMQDMFRRTEEFNQDIGNWDVSSVKDMTAMFTSAKKFNQDIGKWDVSSVGNMQSMFREAEEFNQDIGDWDVSVVTNMQSMFREAEEFNQDIGDWDVLNVTEMQHMFQDAKQFNQDISQWCVTNIPSEPIEFSTSSPLISSYKPIWGTCPSAPAKITLVYPSNQSDSININDNLKWNKDTKATSYRIQMFNAAGSIILDNTITDTTFNLANTVLPVTLYFWRVKGSSDRELDLWSDMWSFTTAPPNFYLHENGVTIMCPDASNGETGDINGIEYTKRSKDRITIENASKTCTSGITDMNGLFRDATTFNGDIGHWDVSKVTDMNKMFNTATRFNQDISAWDVSKVTNMTSMFYSAKSFNQDISTWDVSNVTIMSGMFNRADSFNQPLNSWDVSKVTDLSYMFAFNPQFNQPLSDWNTSSVTNIYQIFSRATSFNQNINNWDVSNITNMMDIFNGAKAFNQPLDRWDVRQVLYFKNTFVNATSFNQDLSAWKLYSFQNTENFLSNTGIQNSYYTSMLISWANDDSTMVFGNLNISTSYNQDAIEARQKLIDDFNWTISDGGLVYYPDSLELISPAQNEIDVSTTPKLTWKCSGGNGSSECYTFQLQLSSDSLFNDTVIDSSGYFQLHVDKNYYWLDVEVPLDFITDYYWRLKGSNDAGTSDWSRISSFTTRKQLEVNNLAIINEDSLHVTDHKPTFKYEYISGDGSTQNSYQFQVTTDSLFETITHWDSGFIETDSTVFSYSGDSLIDGSTYYSRLRITTDLDSSSWKELTFRMNSSPSIPILASPSNNYLFKLDDEISLQVDEVIDAEGDSVQYYFELYNEKNDVIETESDLIASPAWTVNNFSSKEENMSYSWLVRSYDGFEYSGYPDKNYFHINDANESPSSFNLVSNHLVPEEDTDAYITVKFTWENAIDPDPLDTVNYKLYVGSEIKDLTAYEIGQDTLTTISSLKDNSTYYWKVEALDLNGSMVTNNGGYREFKINSSNQAPTIPRLITPTDSSVEITIKPYFEWAKSSDIDNDTLSYVLHVESTMVANNPIGFVTNPLTEHNFTSAIELADNHHFAWYVSVSDVDTTIYSEPFTFWVNTELEPPSPFELISPSNNEQLTTTRPTFNWNKSIDNDPNDYAKYTLVVSKDSLFTDVVFEQMTSVDTTYTPEVDMLNNAKFYWKVIATDTDSLVTESKILTFILGDLSISNEGESVFPQQYTLSQNYPNPFNPSTQIQYALPEATQITLEVFNSVGQKVMDLVNGQQPAGYHTTNFDASGLSSGVYLYKLTTPSFTETKKMLLIK